MQLGDGDRPVCWLAGVGDHDDRDAVGVAVVDCGEQHSQSDGTEEVDPRQVHHNLSCPGRGCCLAQCLIQQWGSGRCHRHGRRVTLDFFSLEDTAARQLLDRYPLTAISVI